MTSIPDLVPALQTLLTTTAEQAGRDSGLIQRVRVFTGATFVQTLVFGWLGTPDATLDQLAQTAATLGVRITGQGIADRFSPNRPIASPRCSPQQSSRRLPQPRLISPSSTASRGSSSLMAR